MREATSHAIATLERILAKEEVKNAFFFRCASFPVCVGHGQLIKVGQECERGSINIVNGPSLFDGSGHDHSSLRVR